MRLIRQLAMSSALALAMLANWEARAGTTTPEATLQSLFSGDALTAGTFDARFLAAVPAAEVERLIAGLRRQHGPLQSIEPDGAGYLLHFIGAVIPSRITLDAEGRVTGLWFEPAETAGEIRDLVAAIRSLPGSMEIGRLQGRI